VNLDKLIQLLLEDKRANPSNYALVVLSEGAEFGAQDERRSSRAD
jgi:6-phosphofructokinase 1